MLSPEVLRRYSAFAEMDPETLRRLANLSCRVEVDGGEELFAAGAEATHLFVVETGEVDVVYRLADGQGRPVDTVVGGELLCWSALVPPHRTTAAAIARTAATLIALQAEPLRLFCEEAPEVGWRLLRAVARALAHRLDAALLQLAASCRA